MSVNFHVGTKLAITRHYHDVVETSPPVDTMCSVTNIEGDKIYFAVDNGDYTGWASGFMAERMHYAARHVKRERKLAEKKAKDALREQAIDMLIEFMEL